MTRSANGRRHVITSSVFQSSRTDTTPDLAMSVCHAVIPTWDAIRSARPSAVLHVPKKARSANDSRSFITGQLLHCGRVGPEPHPVFPYQQVPSATCKLGCLTARRIDAAIAPSRAHLLHAMRAGKSERFSWNARS